MANLTKDRIADQLASGGGTFQDPVAAATRIFRGAMVGLDGAGNAVPAAPATARMRGVAEMQADNRDGAVGDVTVVVKRGAFLMHADGLDRTHVGGDVFVVDDNTVGAAGTLVAGKLLDLTVHGAWVEIK